MGRSRMGRIAMLALAGIVGTWSWGGANAITLLTEDDSWVQEDVPGQIADGNLTLNVRATVTNRDRQALIRFNLEPLSGAGVTGAEVTRAVLRVFLGSVTTAGDLHFHLVTSAWQEENVNWNTKPTFNPVPFGTVTAAGSVDQNEYYTIDITNEVQDWLDGTANEGITVLGDTVDRTFVRLDAKENQDEGHAAEIEVFVEPLVDGATVVNESLTAADLGPNSVGASEIAANAVGQSEIATNGVASAEVLDNSLTAVDLAANSVGASEIAANAVGQSEIATNGVASVEVLDNSLTAADLAANSVGASEIAANAVGTSEIANNSVLGVDIANGTIGNADIASNTLIAADTFDEPGIEYINDSGIGLQLNVTTTWTVLKTLALTMPTAGEVFCSSVGVADWDASLSMDMRVGWDTVSGTSFPPGYTQVGANSTAGGANDSDLRLNVNAQRVFNFASGGTRNFYLKASCTGCAAGQMDYVSNQVSCMYFRTRY